MKAPLTLKAIRNLWLWTGLLAMVLLTIIPLSGGGYALAIALIAMGMAGVWASAGRGLRRLRRSLPFADGSRLPPAAYGQPVILVCGDSLCGLFGDAKGDQLLLRNTDQGCYVQVPDYQQLPRVVERLLAARPQWHAQLNVMLVVSPGTHLDQAVLNGQLRTFSYGLAMARERGPALPLMLVGYIEAACGEGPWFSWEAGNTQPWVREKGTCSTLAHWQQQAVGTRSATERMHAAVLVNAAASWFQERVLLSMRCTADRYSPGLPLAVGVALVPTVPGAVDDSLWSSWLLDHSGLSDQRRAPDPRATWMPYPDVQLPLLAKAASGPVGHRANAWALWLFVAMLVLGMASSAWHNYLLVRQISDDLRRYSALVQRPRAVHLDVAQAEAALAVLLRHAEQLDDYFRHGEPLALGLGLYRGNHLRTALWAAINAHPRSPHLSATNQAARTIRLNSLSLFSSGSAQLKPDATKVLINALADIKAQPGWLIVIAGHTDATGSVQHNLTLSRARAGAVHEWMRRMGDIPDSCFAVQGFGASQPIASNDTEHGRTANRRVDIRLVPEVGACALPSTPDRQPSAAVSGIQ